MKKNQKPELLAPAGTLETLIAVINAGADAVYCGLDRFGARAYAKNFTEEELLQGISYAHLHGAKVYLTVNTCLKNTELLELPEVLAPLYQAGLDAVLVQDFGVLSVIRNCFPELPIHASTQMSICTAEGAAFLQRLGVSRIVTARELSFPELKAIMEKTGMEVECFIHGALCYAYSGLCLMSSMLGGRSGNRGRCAGTCRLPFSVGEGKQGYPLSLKDLCTIDLLPVLLAIGVASYKIEGRMKSPEYAAGVTSIYRKYLDFAQTCKDTYAVSQGDREALLSLGNRSGFTQGFYEKRNDPDMVTFQSPSHTKASDEELFRSYGHFLEPEKIGIKGKAVLQKGEAASLNVSLGEVSAEARCGIVTKAEKRPLTVENIREKLTQTGETFFAFEELTITAEPDCFLPVGQLKELRRAALAALMERLIAGREPTKDGSDALATLTTAKERAQGARQEQPLKITALVTLREQLRPVLSSEGISTVILDSYLYTRENLLDALERDAAEIAAAGKEAFFALPHVFRKDTADFYDTIFKELTSLPIKRFLVRTYDELGFFLNRSLPAERLMLDERLYTYSDLAAAAFAELGVRFQTLPVELNEKELLHRSTESSELIIYGRLPLMFSASCVHKNAHGCDRKKGSEVLTDRYGKRFPVRCDCTDCTNLIFNADVCDLTGDLSAIRRIAPASVRYEFTTESGEEVQRILMGEVIPGVDRTRGHFRRGVE